MQANPMMKLIAVMMLLAAGCGSKDDGAKGEPSKRERSGSAQLPKEDMTTVPAGTFVAKALHIRADGRCSAEIAGEPKRTPSGDFGMDYWKDEPQRVATFAIDKQPVSCADFQLCVEQGGCSAKKKMWMCEGESDDDGLAIAVLQQAEAYCAWRKRRLPSYLEWQAAIRGPTGITKVDCPIAGSDQSRPCIFKSQFGVIATDIVSNEYTRSIECWPAIGSEPVGLAPVEVGLAWDISRSLEVLAPIGRVEKYMGSFRCVRD